MTQQLIRYARRGASTRGVQGGGRGQRTGTTRPAAMQAYGRIAKDKALETDAAEIRIVPSGALEMIASQKAAGRAETTGTRNREKCGFNWEPHSTAASGH